MVKINLGCGAKKLAGYVNVDICGRPDVKCNLSEFPWPFDDSSVDEITSEHFLEHVIDFERTVLEMHRILKVGGTLHFKVPHFKSPAAAWHLHHHQFSTITCGLLCDQRDYLWDGRRLFVKQALRINFVYLRPFINRILSLFANLSPTKWEYLGLPIDEIEFWAQKV